MDHVSPRTTYCIPTIRDILFVWSLVQSENGFSASQAVRLPIIVKFVSNIMITAVSLGHRHFRSAVNLFMDIEARHSMCFTRSAVTSSICAARAFSILAFQVCVAYSMCRLRMIWDVPWQMAANAGNLSTPCCLSATLIYRIPVIGLGASALNKSAKDVGYLAVPHSSHEVLFCCKLSRSPLRRCGSYLHGW